VATHTWEEARLAALAEEGALAAVVRVRGAVIRGCATLRVVRQTLLLLVHAALAESLVAPQAGEPVIVVFVAALADLLVAPGTRDEVVAGQVKQPIAALARPHALVLAPTADHGAFVVATVAKKPLVAVAGEDVAGVAAYHVIHAARAVLVAAYTARHERQAATVELVAHIALVGLLAFLANDALAEDTLVDVLAAFAELGRARATIQLLVHMSHAVARLAREDVELDGPIEQLVEARAVDAAALQADGAHTGGDVGADLACHSMAMSEVHELELR